MKFRCWRSQAAQLVHQFNRHWTYTSSRCTGLLVSAEASQASSSCTGSTGCAWLATRKTSSGFSPSVGFWQRGRRNRMNTSPEMRACLKLNSRVLKDTGFVFVVQFAKTSRSWNYLKLKRLFPAILIYYKIENDWYKNWNNCSDQYWYNIEIKMMDRKEKLIETETEMNFKT